MAAWWPVSTTLSDSGSYAFYAHSGPLTDPAHPAGYPALVALVGLFTHKVVVFVALQHLSGLIAALIFFAATRRITGSAWVGLVPAAAVLLDGDEIFIEHNIMSEASFVLLIALALYAGARAIEQPDPWWRWAPLASAFTVAATVVRSPGLVILPILALVLVIARPRHWRPPVAALTVAVVLLCGYGLAEKAATGTFQIAPSAGWHLYARVAPFADCAKFTPPSGTRGLCETTPASVRPGPEFYLWEPQSPAVRLFGYIGKSDAKLGAFARAAIAGQPGQFAAAVWDDLHSYYVPASHRPQAFGGIDLSPQLDWTRNPGAAYTRQEILSMRTFFSSFTQRKNNALLGFFNGYSHIFRFGATLLALSSVLALIGCFIGTKRTRLGVLLFGAGGMLQLIVPSIGSLYVGRYTVPLAGPMMAAAAIVVWVLVSRRASRKSLAA